MASTALAPDFVKTPQPDGAELAAKLVSLFSFSALSVLFGVKTFNVQFRYLTYSRWLVLALYVLSWAFTVISMVLVTTNNANFTSCFLSIMVCDVFYSGTKLVIYAWLIEKIYIVTSTRQSRWNTKSYRFHVALMLPYVAIFTLMLVFHTAELEASGLCIIGLQSVAALPLIIYDFLINMYMTIFFVRPLIRLGKKSGGADSSKKQSRLHQVALRTLVASVVCLVVSFANIFSLQMLQGRERGLVCLTCCTVDVTINVITIHWVTTQAPGGKRSREGGSQLDYSTHQRSNSNPDQQDGFVEDDDDILRRVNQDYLSHGGRATETVATERVEVPPYSATTMNDISSTAKIIEDGADSMFSTCSIHESQSSRKSLTKN